MKKTIKLTENDLAKIVKRIINEQPMEQSGINKNHPFNNPLYKEFDDFVTGDNIFARKINNNTIEVYSTFNNVVFTLTKSMKPNNPTSR